MKLPRLSPRDELIAELVLLVVVAALLVVFLVMPQIRAGAASRAKQASIRKDMAQAQLTLDRLKSAQQEAIANQAELIKIGNQVPDQPELPTLLVEIQDLANQSGVDFVGITPGAPAKLGSVQAIGLALQLRGQFRDLDDFLSRLYALTREVRVMNVNLTVAGKYPTLLLNVQANTFVMAKAAAPGSTAPAAPAGTP
jgi:type IV pilus assembly protein PilO